MQTWKQSFRKMNLDVDVRGMKPGEYRRLINGSPIRPAATTSTVQDVVCNLIGNKLIANTLPSGTNQIIGFLEDRKSNRAFFCNWNSIAANCAIYQYKDGVITKVMQTSIFAWSQSDFVDMDIVGDVLIFTNNVNDIFKINVVKAIAGGTYTPLKTEITLIKPMPLKPPTWALGYDTATPTNFLAGNYFQFFYRYIYEDYDYSVFSPASKVTNSWLHPSGTDVVATFPNATTYPPATGGGIDGYSDGDRVLLLGQATASQNGIWILHAGAWTRPTDYPNGGNKDVIVYVKGGEGVVGGSEVTTDLGFAQVWRVKCTNIDSVAPTITRLEGPNYLTITRPVSPPATVIGLEYAVRINGSNEFIVYRQEKNSFSSTHIFYNNSYLFTVPDADTFVWSDNLPLKSKSLKIFKNRPFLFNNTEGYNHTTTTQVTLSLTDITPTYPGSGALGDPILSANTKIFRAAKKGGRYTVGVIFHDFGGRHSGVKCENTITVTDDPTKNYKIHVDLTAIAADVPSWAVRKTIVCTKELTASYFVTGITQDIWYYKKDSSGAFTYRRTLQTSGSPYTYDPQGTLIDIDALTKQSRGYTFNQGDRIKIYNYPGNIIDTEILGQEGRFLFVRVLEELQMTSTDVQSGAYLFQIYTPLKAIQQPFFETGFTDVDGTAFDLDGDVEIGHNIIYSVHGSPPYNNTNPYSNNYTPESTAKLIYGLYYAYLYPIEQMSIWTQQFPNWITSAGRPLVKSDSRQINKYTNIRWGQQYILNSNFLGLNTFYALDEQALPIENGAGTRLAEAGEVLVAVHEIETEAIYVGQGFVNIPGGQTSNQFLARTDSVVGDARRYLGGHGSIHPATVVAREGRVYYLDARKGVICRRSQDGVTKISDYGLQGQISTLCLIHASLTTSVIVAGWDPQYDCYCICFLDTATFNGFTFYFHEKSDGWIFMSGLYAEFLGTLGQKQLAFSGGTLWEQTPDDNFNKFFGTQQSRTTEIEFSPLRSLVHIWDAIEIDAQNIYVTNGSNEDVLLLYEDPNGSILTKINYADFKQREGVWRSAFFRWLGDANFGSQTESKYKSAKRIRGQSALIQLVYNGTDQNPMKSITIYYTPSMQSTP